MAETNICVAIYKVGADEIRLQQMIEFVKGKFSYAGEYVGEKNLLSDAEKKKFTHVLVFDKDAIDNIGKLKALNIEVVSFREKERLTNAFKKEIFKGL